jgi:predicted RNase H-like HicB family nuclease
MKLLVTLFPGEDGYIIAECPSIPGCMSQGRTREEALENIKDAILACLEVRKKRGMPLTVDTQEVEVAV